MILKKRNKVISIYQIFIEPKGDQFKDNKGKFENSKEGWKQKFLLDLENKAETDLMKSRWAKRKGGLEK